MDGTTYYPKAEQTLQEILFCLERIERKLDRMVPAEEPPESPEPTEEP